MKTKILALVIGIAIGAYIGGFFSSQTVYVYTYNTSQIVHEPAMVTMATMNVSNVSIVSINVPAVDQSGEGVITILDVQVSEGTGKALANIDKILFWTDTQNSIRTARTVAQNITGIDLDNYDLVYTITANASVIEGSSAGAALTIATIAALEGMQLNSSATITGTINHDGSIGPVGEIVAKAQAAKSAGTSLFLVPLSQSSQVTYRSERFCEKIGITEICTVEQIPEKVDVSEEAGIKVIEVGSIEEALKYFLV